jgi:hypothetical protein
MRKEILRRLSTTHVDRLAVLKHRLMVAAAGVRGRALVGIAR